MLGEEGGGGGRTYFRVVCTFGHCLAVAGT